MPDILTVDRLTKNFGGLTAVSNVSMTLAEGELVGLIGPNGAGKTTVFNLLTGVYPPTSGTIEFAPSGARSMTLNGRKPYDICRSGVARTFQNIRLFKDLTVLDNVLVAVQQNVRYTLLDAFIHTPAWVRGEQQIRHKAEELLTITGLIDKKDELARNLPYGDQRHLEIARALATGPTLLLLDEPAAGMNPNETGELTGLIAWLRKEFNLTILLIEHDMSLVMKICERIYVLDHGLAIASGTPAQMQSNPRVIQAYLGEEV